MREEYWGSPVDVFHGQREAVIDNIKLMTRWCCAWIQVYKVHLAC